MATLTADSALATFPTRSIEKGTFSMLFEYNSGATAFSASATTVLMGKIPTGVRVIDIVAYHSTGAATAPTDYGIQGNLSAFVSAATQAAVTRTVKGDGVGLKVSVSDDAINRFVYATATVTVGTTTASVKIKMIVNCAFTDLS